MPRGYLLNRRRFRHSVTKTKREIAVLFAFDYNHCLLDMGKTITDNDINLQNPYNLQEAEVSQPAGRFQISALSNEVDITWKTVGDQRAARRRAETKIGNIKEDISRASCEATSDTKLRDAAHKDLQRARALLKQRETELWVGGTASQGQNKRADDEEYRRTVLERVLERKRNDRFRAEERKLMLEAEASLLKLHIYQEKN